MVTLSFPLLLIAPAICIDIVIHRFGERWSTYQLAPVVGVVFVVAFLAAQWPFATFLVTNPLARGFVFNADNFVYWMSPTYESLTYRFDPPRAGAPPFAVDLLVAVAVASVSAALGLVRGRWMTRVQR
jgi:hypothetical protein